MNRKIIGILGALLLATVGTIALVAYVQSAKDDASAADNMVDVWVVKSPVAHGTKGADIEKSLEKTSVPSKVRAKGAVTDLASITGLVASTDLVAGEQVVAGRFVTPSASRQGDVPDGLLQVTVELDPAHALGGQLREGDSVAVLLSFSPDVAPYETHLELHKVLVTSIQAPPKADGIGTASSDSKKDKDPGVSDAPTDNLLVTLALDAPSVERVVFGAEYGTVYLSREPTDAPEDGTQVVGPDKVYGTKSQTTP